MSDLTATNCGCSNNSCGCGNGNGLLGGNYTWLILLLLFGGCNGNGTNLLSGGNSCGCGNGNSCCEWIIWLLILSNICGGNGCGNNGCGENSCVTPANSCGCGC